MCPPHIKPQHSPLHVSPTHSQVGPPFFHSTTSQLSDYTPLLLQNLVTVVAYLKLLKIAGLNPFSATLSNLGVLFWDLSVRGIL